MNAPESQSSALYPPGTVFITPDACTVVAQLTTWGSFLNAIAYYAAAIIPKQRYEAEPAQFFDHPIGSGPFQLESWDKSVQIYLEKHPAYWQTGRP